MRVRWAISLEETMTSPSFQNNFRKAVLCVSENDLEDQRRFRFKEDALACLIGRLMPRKAAVLLTSKPWSSLEFNRNSNGKPSLTKTSNFEYNVSHQGDLVVLATGTTRIGVDVMKIDETRRETAAEQMESLKRHFSEEEIESVKGGEMDEEKRWNAFYRIWCLKESILKATGVGLPDGLHNHTFQMNPIYDHVPGNTTTSSQYFHRLIPKPEWVFEESFIGEKHCVAVASELSPTMMTPSEYFVPFEMTSLEEILKDADFINITADVDEELDLFIEKPNKPF
uniref:L-aminoadipate-semialdehyde dehydrogenase-phosphopantetheinyl transferase n=1 Tax=Caenorhabditis tropicalis TaxID=1561998 RepID=A0A1I7SYN2_9PELO